MSYYLFFNIDSIITALAVGATLSTIAFIILLDVPTAIAIFLTAFGVTTELVICCKISEKLKPFVLELVVLVTIFLTACDASNSSVLTPILLRKLSIVCESRPFLENKPSNFLATLFNSLVFLKLTLPKIPSIPSANDISEENCLFISFNLFVDSFMAFLTPIDTSLIKLLNACLSGSNEDLNLEASNLSKYILNVLPVISFLLFYSVNNSLALDIILLLNISELEKSNPDLVAFMPFLSIADTILFFIVDGFMSMLDKDSTPLP